MPGSDLSSTETEGQMIQRVMPDLMGMKNILYLSGSLLCAVGMLSLAWLGLWPAVVRNKESSCA